MSIAKGDGMGNETYVAPKLRCIQVGVGYSPSMDGNLTTLTDSDPQAAVRSCQKLCEAKDGCAHFTIEFPAKICSLSGQASVSAHQLQGHISGPPICSGHHDDSLESQAIQEFVEGLPRGFFDAGFGHRASVATMMLVLCVFLCHLHRTGRCVQLRRTSPAHWDSEFGLTLQSSRAPMISPVLPAFVEEYLSRPSSRGLSLAALRPRTSRGGYSEVGSEPQTLQSDDEYASEEYGPL